jgi:hypothetical protein
MPLYPPQIPWKETKLITAETENMFRGPFYITFMGQIALSKILINMTELI